MKDCFNFTGALKREERQVLTLSFLKVPPQYGQMHPMCPTCPISASIPVGYRRYLVILHMEFGYPSSPRLQQQYKNQHGGGQKHVSQKILVRPTHASTEPTAEWVGLVMRCEAIFPGAPLQQEVPTIFSTIPTIFSLPSFLRGPNCREYCRKYKL